MSSLSTSSIDTLEPEVLNRPDLETLKRENSQTISASVELDFVTRDSLGKTISCESDNMVALQRSSSFGNDKSDEQLDSIDPSEEVMVKSEDSNDNSEELVSASINNSVPQTVAIDDDQNKYTFNANYNATFHRRFPTISEDEKLIDYFSCALLADILLQGFLYISDNYFGFYSNIFGYKTKLLIQMSDVRDITKEKTAFIIPNAIGIDTHSGKYVFGSLFSRDTTYRLMVEVLWRSTLLESRLQLHPLSYDRPVETIDNGNERPVTPGSDVLLEEEMNLVDVKKSPLALHGEDGKCKGQNLAKLRITHRPGSSAAFERDNVFEYDSKEEDSDNEVEPFKCKSNHKSDNLMYKCQKFPCRLKRHWSVYIDKFQEKFKEISKLPAIYLVILLLLIYLSISTLILFIRIGALQDFLDTTTHRSSLYKHAKFSDVKALKTGLQDNIDKISVLKDNINEILDSVNRISSECLAYTKTALHLKELKNHCEK